MINFYNLSLIDKLKKKLVNSRILFYLALSLLIIGEIIFSIFIEYKTKRIFQPIMILYGIVFSLILVFIYAYFIYPYKWQIKRIDLMNRSIKHEIIGVVESIKDETTLRRDVTGFEIVIVTGVTKTILFLEKNEIDFNFVIGKEYHLFFYDNFITNAEEMKYE